MKVIIGSDHAGYRIKEGIKKHLSSRKISIKDVGAYNDESCDYPDYAKEVAAKVAGTENRGILICGTGLGMCMTANKFRGVRAVSCRDEYEAGISREHNDANIICLGGRTTKEEAALKMVDIFLDTAASVEERHRKRVDKISKIEEKNFK